MRNNRPRHVACEQGLRCALFRAAKRAHHYEAYIHLSYFAMLVSHGPYHIAAAMALVVGALALLRQEGE